MMSEKKPKKNYAAFLIDRPFNASQSQQSNEVTALLNCLRHRLNLNFKNSTLQNQNIESANDDSDLKFLLAEFPNSSTTATKKTSLYETLLQLIDEFDSTGAVEIFRLLLERRTAIPLFVPNSRKHHLDLLRHMIIPDVGTRLGDDQSLLRVTVVSCCQKNVSQTSEIMESLFNVQSVHRQDLSNQSLSSNPLLAEIGVGCLVMEEPNGDKVKHLLVIHVIGDFRPLWPFIQSFSNYLLVEDSAVENERFSHMILRDEEAANTENSSVVLGRDAFDFSCVWSPSMREMSYKFNETENGLQLNIEGMLQGRTLSLLKISVRMALKKVTNVSSTSKTRKMLHEIELLRSEDYVALNCVSPSEIQLSQFKNFGDIKEEFVLQKDFLLFAKLEDAKVENRNNETKVNQLETEILKLRSGSNTKPVHPLLKQFLDILEIEDSCSRVLSFNLLEKELAKRGEVELGCQKKEIQKLTTSYSENVSTAVGETEKITNLKEELNLAKTKLISCALNVEHLWRELSHLYTEMEEEKRSPSIEKIPHLAAQHLMDGFPLELLDGDANLIRQDWINVVLHELGKLMEGKRIFVLSVMGVQSSGKSTMLNTMFGIKMRTSVGQCTRGVNMQLLAVQGRPEYDYILLLDTEGTRSPEYHGLAGSEKRDNQMATLSILLSDACIIVIPGENDAAVKEILPIVLMAYEGSKLAQENGDRLSSRMFFLYNRIDTTQENKLDNIIQSLGTSLHTAFNQVQKMTGNLTNLKSESPFGSFNLDSSDSTAGRDVCILGNVKSKYEPPDDVPDEVYGEKLVKFREHIHRRVVSNAEGKMWESSMIDQFSSYIKEVWYCIRSANFNLNFATIVERMTFDQLENEYNLKETELSSAYMESFERIKKEMREMMNAKMSNTNRSREDSSTFIAQLLDEMSPTVDKLGHDVTAIIEGNGREKWEVTFLQRWKLHEKVQEGMWKRNLRNAFDRIFLYEERAESYKKEMRQEINKFFKSKNFKSTEVLDEKFADIFNKFLCDIEKEFPQIPKFVEQKVNDVYETSSVIKNRKIDPSESEIQTQDCREPKKTKESLLNWLRSIVSSNSSNLKKEEINNKIKEESFKLCFESVPAIVNSIATGKICYDDSIVYNFIQEVDAAIINNNIVDNSDINEMHKYGRMLIIEEMEKIQKDWDENNSVYVKFKCSEEIMRNYFDLVWKGAAKTKIFASTMAKTLSDAIIPAFKDVLVSKTYKTICNSRWLYDARNMQKHMDLHLIDLLERKKVDEVLKYLENPKEFYKIMLHRLIARNVSNAEEEWPRFKGQLKDAVKKAASAIDAVNKEIAQTFVNQLREEFSGVLLQSETLTAAFSINCADEYEECDINEEKKKFQEECQKELNRAIDNARLLKRHAEFAEDLSPKVVQHMIFIGNKAALPRCDAYCPRCCSLCLEAVNHDTKLVPHDAIHQPGAIGGVHIIKTDELVYRTCTQSLEEDGGFFLNMEDTVPKKYRDFAKHYPGWNNPKINEPSILREYILATYNKEIAKKYDLKPCPDVPSSFYRKLSTIKKQLKMEI